MSDTIAFLGLGAMGERMARRLADAGTRLVVWNRTPGRADALVAAGARVAATPADAARGADAVITMVADPAALAAVTEGPDGAVAGAGGGGGGTTFIEMSTVGPAAVERLRAAVPAGTVVMDAPVLGSLTEVEAGTLHVFVGADGPSFERWAPVLSALGTVVHVGGPGAGAAAKLVANATLFGVLAVLGESLAVGRGLGLPDDVLFDVLERTPLAAQATRRRPAVESGDYPRRFALALAEKDADLIVDAASAAGVDVRTVAAARSWFADANATGWGQRDYSAVLAKIMGQAAGDDGRRA